MRNALSILFMLLLLTEGEVYAEGTLVKYTTEDGLVNNEVNAIAAVDSAAWIGTSGGISYYNGESWTNYTTADGLVYDYVTALDTAPDGSLWVGTQGGVSHYDGTQWVSYTVYNGLADGGILGIKVADSGDVWVTTRGGVSSFDGSVWTHYLFNSYDYRTSSVYSFHYGRIAGDLKYHAISPDGNVWAITLDYNVVMFDGSDWYDCEADIEYDNAEITGFETTPDGKIWLSYWSPYPDIGDGIMCYDGSGWNILDLPENGTVREMTVHKDGSIWGITGYGSISHFDGNEWVSMSGDILKSSKTMALGGDGTLYASAVVVPQEQPSYLEGIWIYKHFLQPSSNEIQAQSVIGDFSQKLSPNIRIGNNLVYEGVQSNSPEGTWTTYSIGNIRDISVKDDYVWCSTAQGVMKFNHLYKTAMSIGGQNGNIAVTNEGNVWSAAKRVYYWDGRAWSDDTTLLDQPYGGPYETLFIQMYNPTLAVSEDNSVYLATRYGASVFRDNTWSSITVYNESSEGTIQKNGTIWQVSNTNVRSFSDGSWTDHTFPLDKDSYYISNIESSPDDNIWVDISGHSTVSAFSYDGQTWTDYNHAEKLSEYYKFMAHDGVFWKADVNGLHRLDLAQSAVDESDDITTFSLSQNHPNPFNPSTSISFDLPESGQVAIEVFSVTGQKTATLVNGHMQAGAHSVSWDGSGCSAGVYLYRISANGKTSARKMLLLK
ncbi:MAG: T9SS type A sorting domain-containing protein [Candidatus Latescibacteria bacterium]|nr:T9SS type A sorting domain-containing protein [Candidatus Latescibacterota bacterium]